VCSSIAHRFPVPKEVPGSLRAHGCVGRWERCAACRAWPNIRLVLLHRHLIPSKTGILDVGGSKGWPQQGERMRAGLSSVGLRQCRTRRTIGLRKDR